ncbi:ABC transporter substrate-binding protein [Actinomycetota bacterium]|nr:ABC transporter substrate-binding protein [Actinomycetota bacterium]
MQKMDRRKFLGLGSLAGVSVLGAGALVGCGNSNNNSNTAASSKILDLTDWDSIVAAAKGTTVNYWSYGTYEPLNNWYDTVLAPYLKEHYDVTLNVIGVADTLDTVTQISSEMQAGITEGSVDAIYLNGENFYTLMQANYLYGPMAANLPFSKYLDPTDINNIYDTGVQINGYEASWQSIHVVFYGDTAKVSKFPSTTDELLEWCKANPGKFVYVDVSHYMGGDFVATIFANILGEEVWNKVATDTTLSATELKQLIEPGLKYLRDLNPYLWSEGKTFPADSSNTRQMYADGELLISMSDGFPQGEMDEGIYPATTRCFLLEKCLAAFYYLAIPKNATNKAAALVMINAMGEPELQASDFEVLTQYPVIDIARLSPEDKALFDAVKIGEGMLAPEDFAGKTQPFASGRNIDLIEEIWKEEVVGKYN